MGNVNIVPIDPILLHESAQMQVTTAVADNFNAPGPHSTNFVQPRLLNRVRVYTQTSANSCKLSCPLPHGDSTDRHTDKLPISRTLCM